MKVNSKTTVAGKLICLIRKKPVVATPEEKVRQHLLSFLINEKKIPAAKIAVEKKVLVNKLTKRFDVLVYDAETLPILLAECKSQDIKLTQAVIEQAAMYNLQLQVPYLLITNGEKMYCVHIDHSNNKITPLASLPEYSLL